MIIYIFNFCLCFIENFIVFYFLNLLLKKRFQSLLPTFFTVLLSSGIVYACSEINLIIKLLVSLCTLLFGCFVLYKDKPVIKVMYSLLSLYILNITDILAAVFFSVLTNRNIYLTLNVLEFQMTFSSYAKIVDILVFALIYKMVCKIEPTLKNKYWVMFSSIILVFLTVTIAFWTVNPSYNEDKPKTILYTIIFSLLFAMSLMVIYFFSEISKGFRRDSKLLILENNYNNLQEQIEYQRQNEEKFRKLRHDMINHLSNIRTMISSGDSASAVELLDKTAEKVEQTLSDKVVNTGNKIINAILLSKSAVCHSKSICFEYSIEPLGELNIDVTDLSSLISNLLDNAIEAAAQTDHPFVKISFFKYNAYYTVCVENSYKGKEFIKQNAGTLISTKTNVSFHGYGTQIINDIARKYDGDSSWDADGDTFKANVLLKI